MIKAKIKNTVIYQGRWYNKGETANVDSETISAIGAEFFEIIEEKPDAEVKKEITKPEADGTEYLRQQKKLNKKLKDINKK